MAETTQTIDPKQTALLVMDYQTAIIGRLGDADELLSRMAKVIETARGRGIQIGYVRVAFDDDDYAAIPEANKIFAGIKSNRQMSDKSPETAIDERIAPAAGDIIVRKTRVGAFSTTDLDEQLRALGIDTLILAGIATSGVVLSTLRAAADLDYQIFVISDCCADADSQVHDVLMNKVFPRQAEIIDSSQFAQIISGQRKEGE